MSKLKSQIRIIVTSIMCMGISVSQLATAGSMSQSEIKSTFANNKPARPRQLDISPQASESCRREESTAFNNLTNQYTACFNTDTPPAGSPAANFFGGSLANALRWCSSHGFSEINAACLTAARNEQAAFCNNQMAPLQQTYESVHARCNRIDNTRNTACTARATAAGTARTAANNTVRNTVTLDGMITAKAREYNTVYAQYLTIREELRTLSRRRRDIHIPEYTPNARIVADAATFFRANSCEGTIPSVDPMPPTPEGYSPDLY